MLREVIVVGLETTIKAVAAFIMATRLYNTVWRTTSPIMICTALKSVMINIDASMVDTARVNIIISNLGEMRRKETSKETTNIKTGIMRKQFSAYFIRWQQYKRVNQESHHGYNPGETYPVTGNNGPLQWSHNERKGISNHGLHDCLLKHLFRHRWKKTPKLRVTGLCEGDR